MARPARVTVPYRCWDGPEMTGPTAGYQHHRAAGEKPCPACRRAAAQYAQDRRLAPKRRAALLAELAIWEDQHRRERAS
jgi:hypothetical protein